MNLNGLPFIFTAFASVKNKYHVLVYYIANVSVSKIASEILIQFFKKGTNLTFVKPMPE